MLWEIILLTVGSVATAIANVFLGKNGISMGRNLATIL
jgi:hypothetical protein